MSVTPHHDQESNESIPVAPETGLGQGLRPEDILRLILVGGLILVAGLALGNFTFHELVTRGTAYFVVALCLTVVLTAVAYLRFQPTLALAIGVLWIGFGGTPTLANGISSGTGKALFPAQLIPMFLLLIWVLRGVGLRQFRFVRTPVNVPLALYLAFSVWTAVNGWMFWDPSVSHFYAGLPGGGRPSPLVIALEITLRVVSAGTFWVLASNLTEEKWLRWASWLLLLPGTAVLLSYYHLIPQLSGLYDVLLEIVLACTLWAWLLENPRGKPVLRVLGFLMLFLLIFQVFVLGISWISGWFGLFAGLLFVAWLKSRRLFAGLLITAVLLAALAKPLLDLYVIHDVKTSGDLDRFSMMRGALLYAVHFPLGIGPGNYRAYNRYYGSREVWNTTGYTSAHDFYAQSLSEMGFVGLALVWLWAISGAVMLARFYRNSPPGFSRTMILGIAGMWGGLASCSFVGDYLIPVYYNAGLVTFSSTLYAWIGLGIATAHARRTGALAGATLDEAQPKHLPSAPPPLAPWPRRTAP